MRRRRTRVAVASVLLVAVALLLWTLLSSSGNYTVKAVFTNAGQIVTGDHVEVAGSTVGSVDHVAITDDGRAELTLTVDHPYAPLRRGTRALVRQAALTGVANRYVELRIPPYDPQAGHIPDGGTIPPTDTTSVVDFDQLLDTFDVPTRRALKGFIEGSGRQFEGQTAAANAGFHYLSPSISTSSALFRELNLDTPVLSGFLDDSARLVTALASRRDKLTQLVHNLNVTSRALGDQQVPLADAIARLPGFMRQSNTTFVNLRSALGDLTPLVDASKPVASRLQTFLPQADAFAIDARPTLTDLATIIRAAGPHNDLIDLTRTLPPVTHAALDDAQRDGAKRPGAFPETAKALNDSAPIVAFGRPYTPDFFGWLDDFSTTGSNDALSGFARAHTYVNAFSTASGIPRLVPLDQRGADFKAVTKLGQYHRCPGASEGPASDGSNIWSAQQQKDLDCTEADRAVSAR